MGFFSKDKKKGEEKPPKLPKLPSSPKLNLPTPPQKKSLISKEEPATTLPSFPDSKLGTSMNQTTIKDAVTPQENESSIPHPPTLNPLQTLPPQTSKEILPPVKTQAPVIRPPPRPPRPTPIRRQRYIEPPREKKEVLTHEMTDWGEGISTQEPMQESGQEQFQVAKPQRPHRTEPLFIQLDKFEQTISAFDEIKLKVTEIESLLRNIKEVKSKEDAKLNYWENQLETIKARLEEIDKDVFNQL
jgi:hypothetical protein